MLPVEMALTSEDLLARLGVPEPTTPAEMEATLDQAINEILKNDSKSGYCGVLPTASQKNPVQARSHM